MSLTFQEKSLWLMLGSLLVAFGLYFAFALQQPTAGVTSGLIGLFIAAVVLLIVVQVVGHVLIAIVDRRSQADERDRMIELKGGRIGAFVLATAVFAALCVGVFSEGNFVFVHVLLAGWVLAQVSEIGSRLYLYRRGA